MRRFTRFASEFLALESAGGIVMLLATLLALLLANSPFSAGYTAFVAAPIGAHFEVGSFTKDVLMVVFFFAIGMELKLEMREGALAEKGQKLLPLIAALGGILVPALIYLGLTRHHPELRVGWAIPTATDIAFSLCVLRLVGSRVPPSATMFLLAIAIYDDLAAILIIALFYSSGVALLPLAAVAALGAALYGLNRAHVVSPTPYLMLGVALGFALHAAGIHTSVAGVMVGMAIPLRNRAGEPVLSRLLHRIYPSVAFGILPLFAFTSAGVELDELPLSALVAPLPVAIAVALCLGKPLGIVSATLAAVRLGLAPLPRGVTPALVLGLALLAGIGFTMSLFIGKLAFSAGLIQHSVTLGVLAGSLLSSLLGIIFLSLRRTA